MIRPFEIREGSTLVGGGYLDHLTTGKSGPFWWASCDWCGQQAVLPQRPDGYITDPPDHLAYQLFVSFLNWCVDDRRDHHFCSRKCRHDMERLEPRLSRED